MTKVNIDPTEAYAIRALIMRHKGYDDIKILATDDVAITTLFHKMGEVLHGNRTKIRKRISNNDE